MSTTFNSSKRDMRGVVLALLKEYNLETKALNRMLADMAAANVVTSDNELMQRRRLCYNRYMVLADILDIINQQHED